MMIPFLSREKLPPDARRRRHLPAIPLLIAAAVVAWGPAGMGAQPPEPFGADDAADGILSVRLYAEADTIAPGDTVWLAVRLELAPGWHINSAHPRQDYLVPTRLALRFPDVAVAGGVIYPEGRTIFLLDDSMSVYESHDLILLPVVVAPTAPAGPLVLEGVLHYQGCDDKSCVAPDETPVRWMLAVASQRGDSHHPDIFASARGLSTGAATRWSLTPGGATSTEVSDLERLVTRYGVWGYVLAFLLAFGTGFLLSFSPCTYPMIPITVSVFAGQARGAGRGFVLSLIYVLTMAVLYGIVGTVVATVGGVFGAWLAHPVVVGIIVAIFVMFALSMFGLFDLQVPQGLRNRMAGRGGQGVGGAVVLGAVAALVVSPCVGPFVAGIMLYVTAAGSPVLGFFILFTFALGLGTLFVLIGTFSSAIQSLPRAGEWMESVKKFFGLVLLLMALYFLRTLTSEPLTALLAGLLLLSAGVFGGGLDRLSSESRFFARLKKTFGILCLLLGLYLVAGYLVHVGFLWPPLESTGAIERDRADEKIAWVTDLDAGLVMAESRLRPVLIDTWATWCANCRRLDQKTWSDDRVAAEAVRFVPIKLQLETNDAPLTRRFLTLFGLKQYSLPTIILIDSQGRVQRVIYGFVDAATMRQHLQAVW